MLKKLQKSNNKGFTIIEIMIVLAIAALILLIVFLAIPALQRSSRNTSRKSDAGHVSSAVNNYVSNNNGSVPTIANWGGANGDCNTIISDAGNLSQYSAANGFACGGSTASTGSLNQFRINTGAITMTKLSGQAMVLDTGATCPAASSINPTTVAATSTRQAILMYTVEQSSGNWLWDCVTSQ